MSGGGSYHAPLVVDALVLAGHPHVVSLFRHEAAARKEWPTDGRERPHQHQPHEHRQMLSIWPAEPSGRGAVHLALLPGKGQSQLGGARVSYVCRLYNEQVEKAGGRGPGRSR
jgi:hypothetical protein